MAWKNCVNRLGTLCKGPEVMCAKEKEQEEKGDQGNVEGWGAGDTL